jgi:L-2-hydroxyglutarate oxidase LhgO
LRFCIVGGGILGLSLGRLLSLEWPQASVLVLEKDPEIATHQTGRNSGVVHAGLYYEPGSLKARLCRRGVALMRDYCHDAGLPYEECGKVLIATAPEELPALEVIAERAAANGVPGIAMLDAAALAAVEPHARGIAALHSPSTAIVDYRAVSKRLEQQIGELGGRVRCGIEAVRIVDEPGRPRVDLGDGTTIEANRVIVCAGLHADRLARASGASPDPRIVPFRGEYWALRPQRSHLVRGLIYPVPDPRLPFLGVHLTRRVDGSILVGPNAVLALAREGYRKRTVRIADVADIVRFAGAWRLFGRYWRSGLDEIGRSASRRLFVRAARRYVPELERADLVAAPAGVRAQAVDRSGAMVDDFRIDVGQRVSWVRNAPSPAATSSLAIAEELLDRMSLRSRTPVRSTP